MKIRILQLLFSLALGLGCSGESIIGNDPDPNSPLDIFEVYWHEMNSHYAVFDEYGVDWDEVYDIYRPRVEEMDSMSQLWGVLCEINRDIDDAHTVVVDVVNGVITPYDARIRNSYYDESELYRYFEGDYIKLQENYAYAKIADRNIAYISIGRFGIDDYSQIDYLLEQISGYDAFIFDMRVSIGGYLQPMAYLTSHFVGNSDIYLYDQYKNGSGRDDYSQKFEQRNIYKEDNISHKPVVILTSENSVSCAEIFVFSMKTAPNVVQIGATTRGSLSFRRTRILPNGWEMHYSAHRITNVDGSTVEGVGSIPDIYVVNKYDYHNNDYNDEILESAINYIKDNYDL